MEVLKFAVFTQDEFVSWQLETKRKITQVIPFVTGASGYVRNETVGMETTVSAFVVYMDAIAPGEPGKE